MPVEAHTIVAAEGGESGAVGAVGKGGDVTPHVEVATDEQPQLGRREGQLLDDFLVGLCDLFVVALQLHLHLHQLQRQLAPRPTHAQCAGAIVESREACAVAILQVREVEADRGAAGGTLHALGERVGSQVQVGHHAGCLQAQPARTLGEAPGCVHGIVVPLPVLAQLRGAEVVAADDARGGHTTAQHPDALRNATELITHLRPTVNPATGHERRHTPHAAAVLEDDSVPVAVGRIEDSPLPHRSETAEFTIEHHATLVGATDVISPIADLMPMASGRPGNHQQVVATTVLDHAGALEQAALGGTSLEELNVRVGNDIREVWLQFHHLARAVDDVNAVVVIEEERAVVEMTHTGEQRPLTLDIGGRINISVAHGAALVGSQESVEAAVVVLQRGSPLASAIDRAFLQVVLRRVRQTVEDVADGLPVLEVVGSHDGGTRHQVHGG